MLRLWLKNPFSQPDQSRAQCIVVHVLDRLRRPRRSSGVGRINWSPLGRGAAQRLLPERQPLHASPAKMGVYALNNGAAHMLNVQPKARLDPQHKRCGLLREVSRRLRGLGACRSVSRAGRPVQADGLAKGADPRSDNRLPLRQQRRFAEALPGDQWVKRTIHQIRQRS